MEHSGGVGKLGDSGEYGSGEPHGTSHSGPSLLSVSGNSSWPAPNYKQRTDYTLRLPSKVETASTKRA
jgi:hypothetical protein